ncbi:serine/threonine-protein kinase 4 [Pseudozyma hubeiensis SY62]|uniref:Serine/threonine-protein kinase 4 n=1 Tax=Pseudozyma hubeiensis (strain SY62) TaxID=1305764 RepID=R9PEP0_PSEHS|nr:serine/threonine-protein kinase 4 [Pseudozyma hubeiensis SY62]GAC99823.1 serine/threonine-protein kinase 4 [Pseudozyma hubeiensis SY62]
MECQDFFAIMLSRCPTLAKNSRALRIGRRQAYRSGWTDPFHRQRRDGVFPVGREAAYRTIREFKPTLRSYRLPLSTHHFPSASLRVPAALPLPPFISSSIHQPNSHIHLDHRPPMTLNPTRLHFEFATGHLKLLRLERNSPFLRFDFAETKDQGSSRICVPDDEIGSCRLVNSPALILATIAGRLTSVSHD